MAGPATGSSKSIQSLRQILGRLHWRVWKWLQWCRHPEECFYCGTCFWDPEDDGLEDGRCGYCEGEHHRPPVAATFIARDLRASAAFNWLERLSGLGKHRMGYCQRCGTGVGHGGGRCFACEKAEEWEWDLGISPTSALEVYIEPASFMDNTDIRSSTTDSPNKQEVIGNCYLCDSLILSSEPLVAVVPRTEKVRRVGIGSVDPERMLLTCGDCKD